MQSQNDRSQNRAHWLGRPWTVLTIVAFAAILLLAGQPLLAADTRPEINQTVPPPTPAPSVTNPADDADTDNGSTSNDSTGAVTPQPGAAASGLTAVVDVLTLNVRQGPATTFPVIGKLTQGMTVTVQARNTAGDWWLVCCVPNSQTSGWVSAALIVPSFGAEQAAALPISDSAVTTDPLTATTTSTTTVAAPVPGSRPGVVAGVNLNVRQGPSTDNPVVG